MLLSITDPWTMRHLTLLLYFRNTHHVPEVGAESACSLVVLHHTVIVENFPTAVTEGERQSRSQSISFNVCCDTLEGCELNSSQNKSKQNDARLDELELSENHGGCRKDACTYILYKWKD